MREEILEGRITESEGLSGVGRKKERAMVEKNRILKEIDRTFSLTFSLHT